MKDVEDCTLAEIVRSLVTMNPWNPPWVIEEQAKRMWKKTKEFEAMLGSKYKECLAEEFPDWNDPFRLGKPLELLTRKELINGIQKANPEILPWQLENAVSQWVKAIEEKCKEKGNEN